MNVRPSGGDRLGSKRASLQDLGGSAGAGGRACGRPAVEPEPEQPDGHHRVDRPHQRHRRHLRHLGGRVHRSHPLPPAAHAAAQTWRVDVEGAAPLEPTGPDQFRGGTSRTPPSAAFTARWATAEMLQKYRLCVLVGPSILSIDHKLWKHLLKWCFRSFREFTVCHTHTHTFVGGQTNQNWNLRRC